MVASKLQNCNMEMQSSCICCSSGHARMKRSTGAKSRPLTVILHELTKRSPRYRENNIQSDQGLVNLATQGQFMRFLLIDTARIATATGILCYFNSTTFGNAIQRHRRNTYQRINELSASERAAHIGLGRQSVAAAAHTTQSAVRENGGFDVRAVDATRPSHQSTRIYWETLSGRHGGSNHKLPTPA